MEFFVLYVLMILENLQGWFVAVAVIAGLISAGCLLNSVFEQENLPTFAKVLIGVCVLSSLLACMIPSKQEMAIIAAGGVTYNVVTSDAAKQVGGKGVELLNKKLDEMLQDKPEKK
jgi:hypothetical protein